MNDKVTHEAYHPGESPEYLSAAIDRVRRSYGMSEPKPDYTNWRIVVTPKAAGDFGWFSLSSITRDQGETEDAQRTMLDQVRRHVDRVADARVEYGNWYCGACGAAWPTRQEAAKQECCTESEDAG